MGHADAESGPAAAGSLTACSHAGVLRTVSLTKCACVRSHRSDVLFAPQSSDAWPEVERKVAAGVPRSVAAMYQTCVPRTPFVESSMWGLGETMTDSRSSTRTSTEPSANPETQMSLRFASGVRGPLGDMDMTLLRHPTEPSRFALALVSLGVVIAVAVFVLVSLAAITTLLLFLFFIIGMLLLIWVGVQIWRIRLLGDAVMVYPQALPEIQQVLDTVRTRRG